MKWNRKLYTPGMTGDICYSVGCSTPHCAYGEIFHSLNKLMGSERTDYDSAHISNHFDIGVNITKVPMLQYIKMYRDGYLFSVSAKGDRWQKLRGDCFTYLYEPRLNFNMDLMEVERLVLFFDNMVTDGASGEVFHKFNAHNINIILLEDTRINGPFSYDDGAEESGEDIGYK